MSEQPEREPLESALAGLKPAAAALDRDRLMFAAGQAAAPKRHGVWPAASVALFCLSLGLAAALAVRPTETVRIVYVPREAKDVKPAPAPPTPVPEVTPAPRPETDAMVADTTPTVGGDYLRLRRQVLRFGVESLPEAPPLASSGKTLSIDSLIEPPKKRS
jgi:hypothetical protein